MEVSQQISVSGMLAAQRQLEAVSNNLANVSTTGFKRSHAHATDIGYQAGLTAPVGPGGAPVRLVGIGEGAQVADIAHDFLPGAVQATGNPLDMALQGDGFFQVSLPDGTFGYTRDGTFDLDDTGRLVSWPWLPSPTTWACRPTGRTCSCRRSLRAQPTSRRLVASTARPWSPA